MVEEYVKCVVRQPSRAEDDPEIEVRSFCGRRLGMYRLIDGEYGKYKKAHVNEFCFLDLQHALGEAESKGRLLICKECSKIFTRILAEQTDA